MILELLIEDLNSLLAKQLTGLFFFDSSSEAEILSQAITEAIQHCDHCFSRTRNKYYRQGNEVYFNPFHSAQYSIFLYWVSRSIFLSLGNKNKLADRIYYLNKCLNALDLFYEVAMPRVFFADHPVGSVIGRAHYGEYFSFSQNCTVGNNKGKYPTFGCNVQLLSGSKILGDCQIGDNVIVSANTYIKDAHIPSCSLVFGASPTLTIKNKPEDYFVTK